MIRCTTRGFDRLPRCCPAICLLVAGYLFVGDLRSIGLCEENASETKFKSQASSARWNELERFARVVVGACPSSARGHYWLGIALFNHGRTFAAANALRQSLAHADGAATHLALAQAYFLLNQRAFFHEEIAAAKALAPLSPDPFYWLGRYYYEQEARPDLAEEPLKQAVQLNPQHVAALTLLALCFEERHEDQAAEEMLLRAVRTAGLGRVSSDLPFRTLAIFYLDRERPQDALPYIRRAAAIDPNSAENAYVLGKISWKLNDLPAASAALIKAVSLDADNSNSHYILGQVYKAQREPTKSAVEMGAFHRLEQLYGRAAH